MGGDDRHSCSAKPLANRMYYRSRQGGMHWANRPQLSQVYGRLTFAFNTILGMVFSLAFPFSNVCWGPALRCGDYLKVLGGIHWWTVQQGGRRDVLFRPVLPFHPTRLQGGTTAICSYPRQPWSWPQRKVYIVTAVSCSIAVLRLLINVCYVFQLKSALSTDKCVS